MQSKKKQPVSSFGDFLHQVRVAHGLTQVRMAKACGLSTTVLRHMEKGRQAGRPGLAVRIARKFGLPEHPAVEAVFIDQLRKAKLKMRVMVWNEDEDPGTGARRRRRNAKAAPK